MPAKRLNSIVLVVGIIIAAAGAAYWFLVIKAEKTPGAGTGSDGDFFVDICPQSGIDFVHESGARGKRFLPETMGAGAGWIDYDGDGLYDLYLVNGNLDSERGGEGKQGNRLYHNRGGGRFEDVTDATRVGDRGYGCGLAVGDYDNDGDSDLYVTNYGKNVLYRNDGGRFEDVTDNAKVPGEGWSTSATFLDYDNDGDLDLYVCQYVEYDPARVCEQNGVPIYCSPKVFLGAPDLLYRNNGDGTFRDVSSEAKVDIAGELQGKSLGVVTLDFNDDGRSDIYVACDSVRNLLFQNVGDGTFDEVGLLTSVAYSDEGMPHAGMGVDAGDVDLDGHADLVVTNFADEPNALYLSQGPDYFLESSASFGLGPLSFPPLGFGVLLIDFDFDSDLDLYVGNGHIYDNAREASPGETFRQPDQLYENNQGKQFRDVSKTKGQWFQTATVSRAVAGADVDNDGDADLLVANIADRPALLRNDGARGHWIGFRLRGTRSNADGYGTKVILRARRSNESFTRVTECRSGRSYQAACDPRVRFGLGEGTVTVEEVEFRWPSGVRQTLKSPAVGQYYEVVEVRG